MTESTEEYDGKYILDGHTPVEERDLSTWSRWYASADRTVKRTYITDDMYVSTVFLGLDHQYEDGPPLLFETMVFGIKDEICERYSTWDEAVAGHDSIVKGLSSEQRN